MYITVLYITVYITVYVTVYVIHLFPNVHLVAEFSILLLCTYVHII